MNREGDLKPTILRDVANVSCTNKRPPQTGIKLVGQPAFEPNPLWPGSNIFLKELGSLFVALRK